MKLLINLLGVVTAGLFGYALEPQIRPQLTGNSTSPAPVAQESVSQAAVNEPAAIPASEPPAEITPAAPTMPETPVAGDSAPADTTPEAAPAEPLAPAPEATPAEPPAVPAIAASSDPVAAMQASIRGGKVKEFTFEQVLKWEPSADETVEGETYTIGLASYKAATIFGEKTIQAKALIKDGIVQKWIWPKSGMEIK